jgi:hypothetical protein
VTAFDDLAGRWEAVADRCATSLAIDVCRAQAERFVDVERLVTPKRTGALADSERIDMIGGGGAWAIAVVSPHKIYAGIENFGGTIEAQGQSKRNPRYAHVLAFDGIFARKVHHPGKGYVAKAEGAARGEMDQVSERVMAWILDA